MFKKFLGLLLIVFLLSSCVGVVSARNYGVYPGVDVICFVGEEFNVEVECESYDILKGYLEASVKASGVFERVTSKRADAVYMPLREGVFDSTYNIRFCIY